MPKLLLVTDATWVSNEVKAALGVGDWHIEEIVDPAMAIDRVANGFYHAVIVDMQVGSMGGMAVIRAIRQATVRRHQPRLVLLLDRVADRFIAKRSGADAAVLKPLQAADLRQALQPVPVTVGAEEE
ncbi:MAG: response regulator [Acidimicrobiia bacterium]